jgi:hypothetical protein
MIKRFLIYSSRLLELTNSLHVNGQVSNKIFGVR